MSPQADKAPAHFKTMEQANVPQGRHGKHNQIVTTILRDLGMLKDGSAIKIPLADLAESKEKVRSALNRATRKAGRDGGDRQRRQLSVRVERQRLRSERVRAQIDEPFVISSDPTQLFPLMN